MPILETNNTRIFYEDHAGDAPAIVLIPGLTANHRAFDGLIAAGLNAKHRVITLDMRGRGQSDHTPTYTMLDHANDVLGLLDALNLDRVVLAGHSFGGLMTIYLGSLAPERFSHLIIMDAGIQLATEATRQAIQPSLQRLGAVYPSWNHYRAMMQAAPFFEGAWNPMLDDYYRADIKENADGTVQPRSTTEDISEVMDNVVTNDWLGQIQTLRQPILLIQGVGSYGPAGSPALFTEANARETLEHIPHAKFAQVSGNHMTMLYGESASQIVSDIDEFLNSRG